MRKFLYTAAVALIGIGFTILFGSPTGLINGFADWPIVGAVLVCVGLVALVLAATIFTDRKGKRLEVMVARADLAKVRSDLEIQRQFHMVAVEYNDGLREQALDAIIAELEAKEAIMVRNLRKLGFKDDGHAASPPAGDTNG